MKCDTKCDSPVTLSEAPPGSDVAVDLAIGSVVLWGHERGLIRDTHIDAGVQWFWIETATRAGWTHTLEAAACHRCHGSRWWWSRDTAIRCGFSHDWVPDVDKKTGKQKGPGHPADPDHLNECCRHRFRFAPTLAILCFTCHPPTPSHADWSTAWREIAALSSGLTAEDHRLQEVMAALRLCDVAFEADDWVEFQQARLGVVKAMQGIFNQRTP